jgi:hypothetical protein
MAVEAWVWDRSRMLRTKHKDAIPRQSPDSRDPTQLHAVHIQSTFSHFQSTFSHMWIHIQSTWGSTYVVPHARGHRGIYGVQRRMVETM